MTDRPAPARPSACGHFRLIPGPRVAASFAAARRVKWVVQGCNPTLSTKVSRAAILGGRGDKPCSGHELGSSRGQAAGRTHPWLSLHGSTPVRTNDHEQRSAANVHVNPYQGQWHAHRKRGAYDRMRVRRCRRAARTQLWTPAVDADFRQQAVHFAAPSHSVAQPGPLRTGQSCIGSPVTWCSAWKSASDSRLRT
jgi:hypothetical protein